MAVPIQSVGKLGDPYTNLPKVYTRGNFEETALKEKYGSDPSRRDMRQFKRYLKSDAGVADRQTYIDTENAKEQASYSAYAKALGEQSKARMLAAKADFDKAIQKFDAPVEETPPLTNLPTNPPTKPATLTPRSEAEWNRIASEATNGQLKTMADVEAWQRANGFSEDQIDGKFGNYSKDYFKNHNLGKYQIAPVEETTSKIPSGYVELSRPDGTTFLQRTSPITTPKVENTASTSGFNFDSFVNDNSLESMFRDGKRYARYDPKGAGDFWVGEDGSIHEVTLGGGFGSVIHNTGINSNYAFDTKRGSNLRALKSMLTGYNTVQSNKQGGTMNRINYFQQGGATPKQDLQAQVVALVQAAMQGDQKATQTVNQIMEAAKAGDQQALQIAQMIQQVVEKMKGQATSAKWGTKLLYLQALKCGGSAKKKMKKGAKVCPECEKKIIKKNYFGGSVDKFGDGGETKQSAKKNLRFFDRRNVNIGNDRRVITETVYDYDDG